MADHHVFEMALVRENLFRVPEPELKFFLESAKALNEICILRRLLMIQRNDLGKPGPDREGRIATYIYLLLRIASALSEAWECLQKSYFTATWNAEHTTQLTNEGRRGLAAFKAAMTKGSPFDAMRNKVPFRADGDYLLHELIATEPEQRLTANIATDLLNTMYVFVEQLSVQGAVRVVDGSEQTQQGLDVLFKLVTGVAGSAMAFLNDAVAITLSRHEVPQLSVESISVEHCQDLADLRLPFLLRPLRGNVPEKRA